MKRIIYPIFIALIFFVSCNKVNNIIDTNTKPSNEIFPLKVGNNWIIKITNYDTLGNTVYSKIDTLRILTDTLIQNEKWFRGYGIITNRSDGLYDYEENSLPTISLEYKFPATKNTSYDYRGALVTIVSTSDSVNTLNGNYFCYHYRIGISTSYADWYLSPGVGIIRADFYNPLTSSRLYKYLNYELIKANIY